MSRVEKWQITERFFSYINYNNKLIFGCDYHFSIL
jgi:hypothetical protein